MKKNIFFPALALAFIAALAVGNGALAADAKPAGKMPAKAKGSMMATAIPDLTAAQTAELKAGVTAHQPAKLTFHIVSGMFWYAPNEIRVKQGDTVTFALSNANGFHDLNLPGYNQKTKMIEAGQTDSFTFKANQKGTFEFYCSVGKGYHRMKGQIGVLLVE